MSGFFAGFAICVMLVGWALLVLQLNALATSAFLIAICCSVGALAMHRSRPQ